MVRTLAHCARSSNRLPAGGELTSRYGKTAALARALGRAATAERNLGMRPRAAAIVTISMIWAGVLPAARADSCRVHSGQRTAALVELYTSEGCSSCPPADQKLSGLSQALAPQAEGYALALHVDYWDGLGWRDPYAQSIFSERHRWLVHVNHHATVYTPHFFVSGTELPPGQDTLPEQVRAVNERPAQAQIELRASRTAAGALALDAAAQTASSAAVPALYIAVAESGLVSNVLRGENGGRTLVHDHVARTWIGPIALVDGEARVHREVTLPGLASSARWEVTAFVEDERTGKVLQTVGLQPCAQF